MNDGWSKNASGSAMFSKKKNVIAIPIIACIEK
jgi:hypothetical protein